MSSECPSSGYVLNLRPVALLSVVPLRFALCCINGELIVLPISVEAVTVHVAFESTPDSKVTCRPASLDGVRPMSFVFPRLFSTKAVSDARTQPFMLNILVASTRGSRTNDLAFSLWRSCSCLLMYFCQECGACAFTPLHEPSVGVGHNWSISPFRQRTGALTPGGSRASEGFERRLEKHGACSKCAQGGARGCYTG